MTTHFLFSMIWTILSCHCTVAFVRSAGSTIRWRLFIQFIPALLVGPLDYAADQLLIREHFLESTSNAATPLRSLCFPPA
jgi:hypothetical protein